MALIPPAAAELVRNGHEVLLQSAAGVQTGYSDQDYIDVGVRIVADAQEVYRRGAGKTADPRAHE